MTAPPAYDAVQPQHPQQQHQQHVQPQPHAQTQQQQQRPASIYQQQFAPQSQASLGPIIMAGSDEHRMHEFQQVIQRLEISQFFAAKLRALEAFEIVVIADDSGSMSTPLAAPANNPYATNMGTRWTELKQTVKKVCEVACLLDKDGIDLYFLNRGVVRNVNNVPAIEQAFSAPPQGYTPTQQCMRSILADKRAILGEKKLLILCCTDGLATTPTGQDDMASLAQFLKYERPDSVHLTFLACTDDAQIVSKLQELDEQLPRCDVCDDYLSERAEIMKAQSSSFPFSHGDYIVKILLGTIDSQIDKLDERPGQQAHGKSPNPDACCVIS